MKVGKTALLGIGLCLFYLLTLSFTACGPSIHIADARPWLHGKDKPAEIDITGQWGSSDWGSAHFSQNGNVLTGRLGDFSVEGVVSGKDIYLLITYDGSVYYTAHLSPVGDHALSGRYAEGTFVDQNASLKPIKLTSLGKIKSLGFDGDNFKIKWNLKSDPPDAHVFWRAISINKSIQKMEKRYLGNTPVEQLNPLKIQGLSKENVADVSIEVEISKRGYQNQKKIFNLKDIIEQKEISWMFELEESR